MAQTMVLFLVSIAVFASSVQGYCNFNSRELHSQITKATLEATRWLIESQDSEGKWVNLHTTGNVLATLKILDYNMNETKSCAKPIKRAAHYFKKSKGDINTAHGGQLAYIVMGLQALCEDPGNYESMNLTKNLLQDLMHFPKGSFNHYFQYSLAMMALGLNNVRVPWPAVKKLIDKVDWILATGEKHTKDTCALFVYALKSVYKQFTNNATQLGEIDRIKNMLTTALGRKLSVQRDNLWTKSLVMQAQTANERMMPYSDTKCKALFGSLLSQKGRDGSFGSLSAALHVLPALAGVSYLDLAKDSQCATKKPEKEKKVMIDVCVKVTFPAINKPSPAPMIVSIQNGSTAFDAFKAASKQDDCYKFISQATAWGQSITTVCRIKRDHSKRMYWMFYVDGNQAMVGVDSYVPKPNECVELRYES